MVNAQLTREFMTYVFWMYSAYAKSRTGTHHWSWAGSAVSTSASGSIRPFRTATVENDPQGVFANPSQEPIAFEDAQCHSGYALVPISTIFDFRAPLTRKAWSAYRNVRLRSWYRRGFRPSLQSDDDQKFGRHWKPLARNRIRQFSRLSYTATTTIVRTDLLATSRVAPSARPRYLPSNQH